MKDQKFIRIDEWVPKKSDKKITYDGKLIVIPFDKFFNRDSNTLLNNFIIKKESYINQLEHITHYINYFIKFYDEENELILAYLKLKFLIDNKDRNISLNAFIKILYSIIITDNMIEKINNLVEDNYYIDLSSKDKSKKYNESLEFTEKHAKIMMSISMAMKIIIPPMFHYLNSYGLLKDKEHIFRFYERLFDIFSKEVDIYNKLWLSIMSKVNINYVRNSVIWEQREIFGTNPFTHMTELFRNKIIIESFFKYKFNNNLISYNYVVLENQLRFFLIEPYKLNRIELTSRRDIDGRSGIDKIEMNATKIDESIVILSDVNIKHTIKEISKKMHMKISKKELDYYKYNMNITKFQSNLVFYYYAKYFYGYRDLLLLTRKQYIKLLVILKKRLQYQSFVYLPQILTSNIESKLNSRTIRNDKFLTKIQTSSIYQYIMENKYSTLNDIGKDDIILKMLSSLLNTTFTFVDYDNQELLGKPIEVNQDIVCDEFLNFLNQL